MADWSIGELAKRADVTPRTIRYYVELGLLPPPHGGGRGSFYGQEHMDRLHLIKRLQMSRLSLEEIRDEIAAMTGEEASDLAAVSPTPESASEYLSMLRQDVGRYELRMSHLAPGFSGRRSSPDAFGTPQGKPVERGDSFVGEPWTRIPLTEDVELHVRRRGNRTDTRIARLIKEARRILKEEQPE